MGTCWQVVGTSEKGGGRAGAGLGSIDVRPRQVPKGLAVVQALALAPAPMRKRGCQRRGGAWRLALGAWRWGRWGADAGRQRLAAAQASCLV